MQSQNHSRHDRFKVEVSQAAFERLDRAFDGCMNRLVLAEKSDEYA